MVQFFDLVCVSLFILYVYSKRFWDIVGAIKILAVLVIGLLAVVVVVVVVMVAVVTGICLYPHSRIDNVASVPQLRG